MRWTVTYSYVAEGAADGRRVVKSIPVEANRVDAESNSSMIFFVDDSGAGLRAGFPIAGIISIIPEDEDDGVATVPPLAQPPTSALGNLEDWPRPWPTDDPMALCAS